MLHGLTWSMSTPPPGPTGCRGAGPLAVPIAQGQSGPAGLWQCWAVSGSSLEQHRDRLLQQALADAIFAITGKTAVLRVVNSLLRDVQEGNCCVPVALQHPTGNLQPPQVCLPPA